MASKLLNNNTEDDNVSSEFEDHKEDENLSEDSTSVDSFDRCIVYRSE